MTARASATAACLTASNWSLVQTCTEATGTHTTLRVQFYPAVGSPTVEIDDVNVDESLAVNGGFENGGASVGDLPGHQVQLRRLRQRPRRAARVRRHALRRHQHRLRRRRDHPGHPAQDLRGPDRLRVRRAEDGIPGHGRGGHVRAVAHRRRAPTRAAPPPTPAWATEPTGRRSRRASRPPGATPTSASSSIPSPARPRPRWTMSTSTSHWRANGGFEHGGAPWAIYPGTTLQLPRATPTARSPRRSPHRLRPRPRSSPPRSQLPSPPPGPGTRSRSSC